LDSLDNETDATIESTMVGPLWARAKYSQLYPEILDDRHASSLMEKVRELYPDADGEFQVLEEFIDELLGLAFIIRARTFDDKVGEFLVTHPNASIVNLGCGLDTTFERVDNGRLLWFDLDLPDAIDFRRRLIPDSERSRCIAKSILDYSWMDDVEFEPDRGLLLLAGGLFAYFEEQTVAEIITTMASRFPGSELVFDSSSSGGNRIVNRRLRKQGVSGIDHEFDAKSVNQVEDWSDLIRVIDWFPFFSRVKRSSKWSWRTRFMMAMNSLLGFAKFIHLQFSVEC
jgi:O-methyltransferase involved in polyketide biosynthesis